MQDETEVQQRELALATAGDHLRDAREKKGVTLEQIAAETRIPIRHLEAIEVGDFASLPARTYAIGFSRTFAQFVELDPEMITDLVREELADAGPRDNRSANAMEPGDAAKLPTSGLAWFGAIAALLLVAGLLAAYSAYFGAGEGPASLVQQAAEEDAEQSATATADASEGGAAAAAVDPQGAVVFTALEDGVWVRFYENSGERLFEKQMASGETFELPASAVDPRINTGRPDAFAITIGGQAVAKLSDEPITIGDAAISAEALLARQISARPTD